MAAPADSVVNTENSRKQPESDSEQGGPECSVCLQTCVLPTRLPCSHVFCFLCAKGLALQSRRCAMCRAEIPQEFLERPELLDTKGLEAQEGAAATEQEEPPDKTFAWFYEGRNGWWQYETRLTAELETAYQHGERTHDALIAGSIYTLDFNNWMQCRRDDPSRRRRIKRDLATSQHKGVAGLRQLASVPACSDPPGPAGLAAGPQGPQAGPATAQQLPGTAPFLQQPAHHRRRWRPYPGTATYQQHRRQPAAAQTTRRTRRHHFSQDSLDLRDIIQQATNNAFATGFGAGAALYSGVGEPSDDESDSTPEEESCDEQSDDDEEGANFVVVGGRPYFLINNQPITIESDSD